MSSETLALDGTVTPEREIESIEQREERHCDKGGTDDGDGW